MQIASHARMAFLQVSNTAFLKTTQGEPKVKYTGVPHASFDNPLTTKHDARRESIEFRVLVTW